MESFRLTKREHERAVECPICKEQSAVSGRVLGHLDAGGGFVFRPDGRRRFDWFRRDVTICSGFYACASCGHVWSHLSASKLAKLVRRRKNTWLTAAMY